ncbi:putative ubiquitin carboxyl-terminal hydrolase 50 [Cyclopterus lumpus]|uniref:USP domain-containing protein n=1 Tax=Cyclopterus lumpus TaxID=8103 RepID=A0A8C2XAJ9_CYCLU|nr:putative ubiquitin carboxyl-terminal hydrolase 50 [Cyclopterus lumpus]
MALWANGRKFIYKIVSSPAKTYHGLVNQGSTCYLNSVLQVLFMTEDFREAVKRHTCDHSGPTHIDLHLTSLFEDLKAYDGYTFKITRKLCIDNVYEQRDAAEFFEKILGLTSREASQIFHGEQTQKTICSMCSTETGSDGPFWNLTLALVNSYCGDYSVVAGIEDYFRDSYFSGENQMYCDVCQAKSDATIKWEIKVSSRGFDAAAERFEFDYRYMAYVKTNCFVKVPCTLQIPENQTYELYAVVDHFGDLRFGHYTATIKPQDSESWYYFNDERVTLLDYLPFQVDNFIRSSSAYLLFYRKKKVYAADTCTQDPGEMFSPACFRPHNQRY